MIRDFLQKKTYVPECYGNKDLPLDEQITVTYPAISRTTRMTIMPRMKYTAKSDPDGNPIGFEGEINLSEKTLLSGVKLTINNFSSRAKGTNEIIPIRTAEDIFEAPDEVVRDLIDELVKHFRGELKTVPEEKN